MRIDGANSIIRSNPENLTSGTVSLRDGETSSSSKTRSSEGFSPTSDLTKLLQALRDLPEVREDVVFDVQFRLLSGELDSPEISPETSQEILDSDEA